MLKLFQLLILLVVAMLATSAVAQQYTPVPHQRADAGYSDQSAGAGKNQRCEDDKILKPGQKGFMHCEYHPLYQKVFTVTSCSCSTGQCRATDWRVDPKSPSGISFKIDGVYCPVNKFIDGKQATIPPELRTEPGHVCVEDNVPRGPNGCPPIEQINCAIWNDGS